MSAPQRSRSLEPNDGSSRGSLKEMVARDGIEPPPPAFSGVASPVAEKNGAVILPSAPHEQMRNGRGRELISKPLTVHRDIARHFAAARGVSDVDRIPQVEMLDQWVRLT